MCTYNAISSHTDHFEIQKKGFRRKSIDFCKSVSQEDLFSLSQTATTGQHCLLTMFILTYIVDKVSKYSKTSKI